MSITDPFVRIFERALRAAARRTRTAESGTPAVEAATDAEPPAGDLQAASIRRLPGGDDLEGILAELELERRRYRELFHLGPGVYVVSDGSGKILEANRPATELFGVPSRFLVGKPLAVVVPPEARKRFRELLARVRSESTPIEVELEIESRGGGPGRLVHAVVSGSRDEAGMARIRWLFRDVTEERQRERDLVELNEQLDQRVAERTAELEAASREKDVLLEQAEVARAEAVELLAEIFSQRARFQAVVRHLPVGVVVLEAPSARIVLANSAAAQITGRRLTPGEIWNPESEVGLFRENGTPYAASELPVARTLATGEEVGSEELELRASDRRTWIETSSTPVTNEQGEVLSVLVLLRDITERRRDALRRRLLDATDEVLKSGFDRHKTLRELVLRTVPLFADWAAVDMVEEGRVVRLASGHADLGQPDPRGIGRRPRTFHRSLMVDEVVETGKPVFHPHVDAELAEALEREAAELGTVRRLRLSSCLSVPVVSRDSVVAVLSFGMAESGRPLDDADLLFAVELARLAALAGEAAGLFEQLATERNRLSVVIDRFQDAVVTVTPELEIELANPSAHDLLGGELLPGVSLPNPWPEVVDLPALAGSLFKPGARPIERMVTLDGNDRTLELIGLPARGDSTAVIVVRDASERERADRAEREFVANAAHELRTPLAAITAAAEALDLGAKDVPADRDRFLAHLRRECERLTRLTDSLLVLARAQSGAEPPSTERIDVPALLKGIAGGLRPRRGVDVKVRCRDGVAIEANRALVEQALRNLAQNASKFTRQGRVELTAGHSDGVVVLEVRDTGPGIPAAERERVFRRFYRTGRRSSEGFGLGLAIVRESIRAAGGTVELMSEPNRGTAVRLTFPKPAK